MLTEALDMSTWPSKTWLHRRKACRREQSKPGKAHSQWSSTLPDQRGRRMGLKAPGNRHRASFS